MKLIYIFLILVGLKQLIRFILIKIWKYKRDIANFTTKDGKIKIHKLNKRIEWIYRQ